MKRLIRLWMGGILCAGSVAASSQDVSDEAVAELGSTYGTPQMNGFVFIDGRYLSPPYTVSRKGNGLYINRVLVAQPMPWASGAAAAESVAAPKKAVDADGDFEEVVPAAEPAADPAEPAGAKTVKSIDELFEDDKTPAADVPAAAAAARPEEQRTPEDRERRNEEIRTGLDNMRKGYEQALGRGEIFFFGQQHSLLNGTYGTARTLMGVLPKALRQAQTPQELMQLLNQGGVYFIDLGICSALLKNKTTFPLLEERQRRIEEAEELEASRRNQPQTR